MLQFGGVCVRVYGLGDDFVGGGALMMSAAAGFVSGEAADDDGE